MIAETVVSAVGVGSVMSTSFYGCGTLATCSAVLR
jgi:hypothetical protein